jgi:predicted transcriptional regulator
METVDKPVGLDMEHLEKGTDYFFTDGPDDDGIMFTVFKVTKHKVHVAYFGHGMATDILEKKSYDWRNKKFYLTALDAIKAREIVKAEMEAWRYDRFRQALVDKIENSQKVIEEFAAELVKHPAYTMDWSGKAFQAAANIKHMPRYLEFFDKGMTIEEIKKHACSAALDMTRSIYNKSTSPTSNLMKDWEASVLAELGSGFWY